MSALAEAARNSAENAAELVVTATAHKRTQNGIRRTVQPVIGNTSCSRTACLRTTHFCFRRRYTANLPPDPPLIALTPRL